MVTNLKGAQVQPAGVFFSEIFMVFIVPIVPIVPIFLLKMAAIAMPWARRFI